MRSPTLSSPNFEPVPSTATVKFEEALKNIQKMAIIGKLKEKRTEIETIEQPQDSEAAMVIATCTPSPGKRKTEGAHRPSSKQGRGTLDPPSGSTAAEDGPEAMRGRSRWRKYPQQTPERQGESIDNCLDKTPSTPEIFDFDDLEKSEAIEKGMKKVIGRYNISTPTLPEKHEVGVQAHTYLEDKEVQTNGEEGEPDMNDEGFDMTDVEYIDGVLCKHLCMAESSDQREKMIEGHEKDENGFYKLKKGITSDSGAGDTVGPDDESPDYAVEEWPGSRRGLHYQEHWAGEGDDIHEEESAQVDNGANS